ncbi:MAG TPA: hypothetical protein VMF32_21440 [Xanthobacteraceae bacterium]|nr:hypothetical protein [Xanthobacteraceae bacterium]
MEAIDHEGGFEPVIPGDNVIPADLLRKLAASCLRVLDVTRDIIQVDALQSIMQLRTLGLAAGIGLPELRPADVLQSNYDYSRRLSTIIFETQSNAVGSASRSSLDDLSDTKAMHTNYNLFRATPQNGSGLRLPLERVETNRALDRYRSQLDSAIAFLGAKPALPLDHPDLAVP